MGTTPNDRAIPKGLKLEKLVSDISVRFINLAAPEVEEEIRFRLQRLVDFLEVDCVVAHMLESGGGIRKTFSFSGAGSTLTLDADDLAAPSAWYARMLAAGQVVLLRNLPDELPDDAMRERHLFESRGIKAAILMPVTVGTTSLGCISFFSSRAPRAWPESLVETLSLIGEMFGNALARKRTEEALRESEERFRALALQAPVGIFLSDWEGGVLFRNKKLCEITELSPDMASEWDWKGILHPDDRDRVIGALQQALRSGEPFCSEYRYVTSSGRTVWVLTNAAPFRSHDGRVKGNVGVVVDITERREAEASLREALAEISRLKEQLEAENRYLRQEARGEMHVGRMVGQSEALREMFVQVRKVAPTDSTVLVLGETGTGKGLVARAIHDLSPRKDRPFVTVNCAALPANLIESELFGREKGAFTGSHARQVGRFEVADKGTVFLDEIGELPLDLQAKLLRVLQEGEFERLGSPRTIKTDVRVVASTNRDLRDEIRNGRFRQDLYYRLNVFPIMIPPLRERKEDIPILVEHFVDVYARKMGKEIKMVPTSVLRTLEAYAWPGNVRELEHVIERSVITSDGPALRLADAIDVQGVPRRTEHAAQTLADAERALILKTLNETSWRVQGESGAAAILGLAPSTLRSRMRKLGIARPQSS